MPRTAPPSQRSRAAIGACLSEREHALAFNPKLLFDLEAYHQWLSRAVGRKPRELRELCKQRLGLIRQKKLVEPGAWV